MKQYPQIMNHLLETGISPKKASQKVIDVEQYYGGIINAIKDLSQFQPDVYFLNKGSKKSILIDPTLDDKRKQPVIIELVVDHIGTSFTGSVVYTLEMKTPLASASQYKHLKNRFHGQSAIQNLYVPGVKLCLDISQAGGSFWGIYVKSALPLFSREIKENPISAEEVQICLKNLVFAADAIEKEIFQKDLTKEELNIQLEKRELASKHAFRKASGYAWDLSWQTQEDMLINDVLLDGFEGVDIEKNALAANHKNSLVKVHKDGANWYAQVSLPSVDPQKEEISLLEKHLEVFVQGLQWE